jgi:hypothetical protein
LRDDGSIVEEDSFTIDAYYQEGREKIIIKRELRANSLDPGEYRYVHSVELSYYNNRAIKDFTFTSEPFTVYESEGKLKLSGNTSC